MPIPNTNAADNEKEIRRLRRRIALYHGFFTFLLRAILCGPDIKRSFTEWGRALGAWLQTPQEPSASKLIDKSSQLLVAVYKRVSWLSLAGLIGFAITSLLLFWQNILMKDQNKLIDSQNRYFQKSTAELRLENAAQNERNDLARRRELIDAVYRKENPIRMRVESLKTLVSLERDLIDRRVLPGKLVNLQQLILTCESHGSNDCADLGDAQLARVDFSEADLRGASLRGADLQGSLFISADLSGADLEAANLRSTRFRDEVSLATAVPFDRLAARLKARSKLKDDDAFTAAARLKQFGYSGFKRLDTAESFKLDLSPVQRNELDAATHATIVGGVNWGRPMKINKQTRMPFSLDYASFVSYDP